MKETFLEYLNELIYMLETYEDGWWLKYVQEARQSYFENNIIYVKNMGDLNEN